MCHPKSVSLLDKHTTILFNRSVCYAISPALMSVAYNLPREIQIVFSTPSKVTWCTWDIFLNWQCFAQTVTRPTFQSQRLPIQVTRLQVLPKGRSLTANAGTKVAILSKGTSSTAVRHQCCSLLGINMYGSFPLLSAPHSVFSIQQTLKHSGGPT